MTLQVADIMRGADTSDMSRTALTRAERAELLTKIELVSTELSELEKTVSASSPA